MQVGYNQSRFPEGVMSQFDCQVCSCVVKEPYECDGCGQLYCKNCISAWLKKNKCCPNKCNPNQYKTMPIARSMMRMYNNLKIKCQYCKITVTISDLLSHEAKCNKPKTPECLMHSACGNKVNPVFAKAQVCDHTCILLRQWKQNQKDPKKMLKIIQGHLKKYGDYQGAQQQIGGGGGGGFQNAGRIDWQWDNQNKGENIQVTDRGKQCFLKEAAYMFRTIIGNTPFNGGVHYWELIGDSRTENELKIGVCDCKKQNFNTAFCDSDYGWAYYGLGQLRHGSNASGIQYGKRFRKQGVLGVLLDMNQGKLSFSLNGEFMGVAFKDPRLKKGPLYPAVSLLHCAGIRVDTSKKAPLYMQNK